MPTNNTELKKIMRANPDLTRAQVARLTRCKDVSTVDRWLSPATRGGKPNPTHRNMPDVRLFALRVALGSMKVVEQSNDK
jgi:hypothetical protein